MPFRNPTRAESRKYGELLQLDFNYFKIGNAEQEVFSILPNSQKLRKSNDIK